MRSSSRSITRSSSRRIRITRRSCRSSSQARSRNSRIRSRNSSKPMSSSSRSISKSIMRSSSKFRSSSSRSKSRCSSKTRSMSRRMRSSRTRVSTRTLTTGQLQPCITWPVLHLATICDWESHTLVTTQHLLTITKVPLYTTVSHNCFNVLKAVFCQRWEYIKTI